MSSLKRHSASLNAQSVIFLYNMYCYIMLKLVVKGKYLHSIWGCLKTLGQNSNENVDNYVKITSGYFRAALVPLLKRQSII